jgi:pimeloyl-ACP methyl ester carboxylesterase
MKTILKPRKLPATAGTLVASGKGLVVGEDSAKASAASEPEIQITGGHQSVAEQLFRYQVDVVQRSILFMDVLRQRADNMLSHEAAGMPPLLDFAHEVVLDARQFAVPVNYALLRILPAKEDGPTKVSPDHRPILVVDPRAGHGPGIGGFKRDSEVGMALADGRAVYFVVFFPEPRPQQTLADVHHTLRRFVAKVCEMHDGVAPVLYGNCQGGWAVALLAADCEGTAGPVVMNGSPLSYWAGASDVNPMRLAGAFLGGAWLSHFTSDLGNGLFDGAWLVQNFESLNPAHAYFTKNYQLFSQVDTERERFLDFERWWSGYYFLSREEIKTIVESLFIGNQLEQGLMRICEHCVADLRRIRHPVVIFASSADNITPPHQALNWIPAVYPTTQALKDAGQRIVYLINGHVGHLGIFVSASVARHEHHAILQELERIETLPPGLYQMIIDSPEGAEGSPSAARVHYEERQVEDVQYAFPRQAFEKVRNVSESNEAVYASWVSPWVRAWANPWGAAIQKWMHPMRVQRYAFATALNPLTASLAPWAAWVKDNRQPAEPSNAFLKAQAQAAKGVADVMDNGRHLRDAMGETLFQTYFCQDVQDL